MSGLSFCVSIAEGFRPARLFASAIAARHRQRIRCDILGDHRACARDGALADFHRRHQRGVGADEGARADIGAVFAKAVIIAGDGARADIGARAHARVAQIGQMIGLSAFARSRAILHFHEIADMGVFADARARAQPRERPDDGARASTTAPSRWLWLLIRAPRLHLTPGPNTTKGSISTSASSTVSWREKHRLRRGHGDAFGQRRPRKRSCIWRSACASSARLLTPSASVSPISATAHRAPSCCASAGTSVR